MAGRTLKQRLEGGESVVGTFVGIPSPIVAEAAVLAGLDFAVIDQEHGPVSAETALSMCASTQQAGGAPIVRVRGNDQPEIQRALDVGAAGVQVPQVETRADAEAAADAARFAPTGTRGLNPYVRAGEYGGTPDYTDEQNDETLLIVHVEGEAGLDNVDDILAVDGIDMIFLGPYDLSQALGVPGDVTADVVVDTMEDVRQRAADAGKIVGAYADTPAIASEWVDVGVQYVTVSVDCAILEGAFADVADAVER